VIRFIEYLTIVAIVAYSSAGLCRAQGAGAFEPTGAFEPKDPVILIETARTLLSRNDNLLAILIADQAIAEAPHSPFAFHVRGKAFHARAEFEKAAENLLMAYSLYNSRATVYFNRYEAHSRAGEHLAADADLSAYTRLSNSALAAMDDLDKADARHSGRLADKGDEHRHATVTAPPTPIHLSPPATMARR
jgi:tetratricopeptide (TPR) repeat protein